MLSAVEETSSSTVDRINEIDRLFSRTLALIHEKLPHIHKEAVEKIFEQPYTSPKHFLDKKIKSINTAKKYLGQMEALGIMTSRKIGREVVYLNSTLSQLFS